MSSETVRIGTRGSPLALAQAREVRDRLVAFSELTSDDIEIVVIRTTGDQILDRALSEAGGKGLFTTEIEQALTDGRIDLAVHSAKDMPTELPEGLTLAAFLPREDPRDAWFSSTVGTFDALPEGASVGTASLRRGALVRRRRPDLDVVTFRGSVQTRLEKLERGDVDGTLLAVAGLNRLGLADRASALLPLEDFPPALGQGAITIEARMSDDRVPGLLAALDDAPTHAELLCERAFLKVLDGSCRTPIAGYARAKGDRLGFQAWVLKEDGSAEETVSIEGAISDAVRLGTDTGSDMLGKLGGNLAVWLAS